MLITCIRPSVCIHWGGAPTSHDFQCAGRGLIARRGHGPFHDGSADVNQGQINGFLDFWRHDQRPHRNPRQRSEDLAQPWPQAEASDRRADEDRAVRVAESARAPDLLRLRHRSIRRDGRERRRAYLADATDRHDDQAVRSLLCTTC